MLTLFELFGSAFLFGMGTAFPHLVFSTTSLFITYIKTWKWRFWTTPSKRGGM